MLEEKPESLSVLKGLLIAAIAISCVVVVLKLSYQLFDSGVRQAHKDSMKRIMIGLHSYHEKYSCFPPAYILSEGEHRWHSWRVLILPFLGEEAEKVYQQYRFDEPWDGPHNKLLHEKIPAVYCSAARDAQPFSTPFVAVVGNRTAWPGPACRRTRDFIDGASTTVMLMESLETQPNWLEPRDITWRDTIVFFAERKKAAVEQEDGMFQMAFADGIVRVLLPKELDRERFVSLLSPAGADGGYFSDPMDLRKYFPNERSQLHSKYNYHFKPRCNAEDLKATEIVATDLSEIVPGNNTVYCATFQLTWDECREKNVGVSRFCWILLQ